MHVRSRNSALLAPHVAAPYGFSRSLSVSIRGRGLCFCSSIRSSINRLEMQVFNLALPVLGVGALRAKDQLVDDYPYWQGASHEQDPAHWLVLLDSLACMQRDCLVVVRQQHTTVLRRPSQERIIITAAQPDLLGQQDIHVGSSRSQCPDKVSIEILIGEEADHEETSFRRAVSTLARSATEACESIVRRTCSSLSSARLR